MPSPAVHPRFRWAVDSLGVTPTDHVLEVGCGQGIAAGLVAAQVPRGHVTAIDRSAVAVRRANGMVSGQIAAGRLTVRNLALADLAEDREQAGRYDLVFAVNVNLFWVRPDSPEAAVVRTILRPSGTCVLLYDVPDASMAAHTSRLAGGVLRSLGFATERVPGPTPTFVGVRATIDAPVQASVDG